MSSDHRVAGSSPVGCKIRSIAYLQAITAPEKQRAKKRVIGLSSGFAILLELVPTICGQIRAIYWRPNRGFRLNVGRYTETLLSQRRSSVQVEAAFGIGSFWIAC